MISCGSRKVQPSGAAPVYSQEEIVQAVEDHNRDWEWLVAKSGIDIDSPDEKAGGTLYLRMRKDSVIWMLVKKFGVEAARVQLTPDSFQIIYRLERVYDEGRLEDFLHHYNLNTEFRDLQEMLVGNVILPDSNTTRVILGEEGHRVKGVSYDLSLQYLLDPYKLKLQEVVMTDAYDRTVKATFSDYREWDGLDGMIAKQRLYALPVSKTETAYLKLGLKDFEINKPRSIKFSIPSHYERL